MFNKKSNPSTITMDKITLIDICNYTAVDGTAMKIGLVPDLILFNLCRLNKSDVAVRALITTVFPDHNHTAAFGKSMIIVGKKFLKLSNKQQLALIMIENDKFSGDTHLTGTFDNCRDNDKIDAELYGITKYGKAAVSAIKKNSDLIHKGEKTVGLSLYKTMKRAAKNPTVVINKPDFEEAPVPATVEA